MIDKTISAVCSCRVQILVGETMNNYNKDVSMNLEYKYNALPLNSYFLFRFSFLLITFFINCLGWHRKNLHLEKEQYTFQNKLKLKV